MDRDRFQKLVASAVEDLPGEFLARLSNVDIVVFDRPTPEQIAGAEFGPGHTLFGLYEGIPRTRRGQNYGLVPPDKITIFQEAIEASCRDDAGIISTVRRVVRHEIAHHFGIDDDRLRQLER
jgi:predicted Zn-dependent protease with MMP-like domain